jgi:hypothetical protein
MREGLPRLGGGYSDAALRAASAANDPISSDRNFDRRLCEPTEPAAGVLRWDRGGNAGVTSPRVLTKGVTS